jgi:poly-gamma-glutamate synthesis protein (capsule biosynthesis protein)
MTEIAHGAIDAGADIVVGHGPHYCLPVEVYKGKPVFYSLCNLSFHSGHRGVHGDWIGMLVWVALERGKVAGATFRFMRHNDRNETFFRELKDEAAEMAEIVKASAAFGTKLVADGNEVRVALPS